MSLKLIVGLGNPGRGYSANRHNIGFLALNQLAKKVGIEFSKKQNLARVGVGRIDGLEVVLAKPQTYMNASGEAVSGLMRRYSLSPDDLIVIQDDIDLPLGKIRIRRDSGPGGHNGIKSIIAALGTQDFTRVRLGIGRPEPAVESQNDPVVDYVLSDFLPDERDLVAGALERAGEAVFALLSTGLDAAMNRFN
jgi:PTH1 family peptidyl-tRNA hydrolase